MMEAIGSGGVRTLGNIVQVGVPGCHTIRENMREAMTASAIVGTGVLISSRSDRRV